MFKAPVAPKLPPDPFKHVQFTTGMVLGVDDFTQEFAYLTGHDHLLTREVIGYGTVTGLAMGKGLDGPDAGPKEVEVTVGAGVAITPRGVLVRVPSLRCARVNAWLDANRGDVTDHTSPPPDSIRLYVVLCYRECPVDLRPIPGEPCRSEDDSMRESRVEDDYLLKLSWDAPDQRLYDSQGKFVHWLRQIPLDDALVDSEANRAAFIDALRDAAPTPEPSPAPPPDFMDGAPPAGLSIPRTALCEYLRIAFRLWVTEMRPMRLGKNQAVAGGMPDEECVLLGQLDISLTDGRVVGLNDIVITEDQRPYIVSLQMLQEWVLCGLTNYLEAPGGAAVLEGDVEVDPATTKNRVFNLQDIPLNPGPLASAVAGDNGKVLTFRNDEWVAEPPAAAPIPGPLDLTGDVGGTTTANVINKLKNIALNPGALASAVAGDDGKVLTFRNDEWVAEIPAAGPGTGALTGDVELEADGATNEIQRLQDKTLNAHGLTQAADDGKVLTFRNDEWLAEALPALPPIPPQFIVAAGRFNGDDSRVFTPLRNLAAHPIVIKNPANGLVMQLYFLTFDGFKVKSSYIVKGTIVNTLFGQPRIIEVINFADIQADENDPVLIELNQLIDQYNERVGGRTPITINHLCVRVLHSVPNDGEEPAPNGFMIEISDVKS